MLVWVFIQQVNLSIEAITEFMGEPASESNWGPVNMLRGDRLENSGAHVVLSIRVPISVAPNSG
jgi:hypothetical protein